MFRERAGFYAGDFPRFLCLALYEHAVAAGLLLADLFQFGHLLGQFVCRVVPISRNHHNRDGQEGEILLDAVTVFSCYVTFSQVVFIIILKDGPVELLYDTPAYLLDMVSVYHRDEIVPADMADKVSLLGDVRAQDLGEAPDELVAVFKPVDVVVRFEIVDVEIYDMTPGGGTDALLQFFFNHNVTGKLGERI